MCCEKVRHRMKQGMQQLVYIGKLGTVGGKTIGERVKNFNGVHIREEVGDVSANLFN